MQLPMIHLNGTPRERLADQLLEAGNALIAAIDALSQAGPNARDYYPIGPSAIKIAIREHEDRLRMVKYEHVVTS